MPEYGERTWREVDQSHTGERQDLLDREPRRRDPAHRRLLCWAAHEAPDGRPSWLRRPTDDATDSWVTRRLHSTEPVLQSGTRAGLG